MVEVKLAMNVSLYDRAVQFATIDDLFESLAPSESPLDRAIMEHYGVEPDNYIYLGGDRWELGFYFETRDDALLFRMRHQD